MSTYEIIMMLCKNKGVAATALEKELGFGRGSIGKLKTGATSADRLQKIADFFGVTIEYLMTGKEPEIRNERPQVNTIAAHFEGDQYTEEELEEIYQFAEFVKNKRK